MKDRPPGLTTSRRPEKNARSMQAFRAPDFERETMRVEAANGGLRLFPETSIERAYMVEMVRGDYPHGSSQVARDLPAHMSWDNLGEHGVMIEIQKQRETAAER